MTECSERCEESQGCRAPWALALIGQWPYNGVPDGDRPPEMARCGERRDGRSACDGYIVITGYWHPQGRSPYMVLRCSACGYTENGGPP